MPEGPECKIMANYIQKTLSGKKITSAKIIDGRYCSTKEKPRQPPKNWQPFIKSLPDDFSFCKCKGKAIYMKIGNFYLLSKLGMSGRWNKIDVVNTYLDLGKNAHRQIEFEFSEIEKPNPTPKIEKLAKIDKNVPKNINKNKRPRDEKIELLSSTSSSLKKIKLENSLDDNKLWYCDPRRFGTLQVFKNLESLEKSLNKLGPDMLYDSDDNDSDDKINNVNDTERRRFTFESFKNIAHLNKHKNKSLPKFLMDQSIISGVGNYIKCEALYSAKLSPFKLVKQVSNDQLELLFKSIRLIMKQSYSMNGATIKTYFAPDGERGNFFDLLKVYGKETDPEGNAVVRVKTADGRTTHWVEKVQK